LRIYIAGDTEDIPEMKNLKNIDIAFLPVNQPYTMTVAQAIRAAKMFSPKILYPYHFGNTNVKPLKDALKGTGIEVRVRKME
jgi:L-ascorbate metabolism protein UlaG (beta-lactamase superfamily)